MEESGLFQLIQDYSGISQNNSFEDQNTPASYESIDPVIEVMEEELVEED